jgi:hypothetical protein
MLREVKLGLGFEMTLEAGVGLLAGVDDEFVEAAATAHRDVFAAGTVTGFATVLAGHAAIVEMEPRVRTGRKSASDVSVAIRAGLVANESRALNLKWFDSGAVNGGTRVEQ